MLNKVYSDKIIRYAANIPMQLRLDNPHATARKKSDFCGSSIIIDIKSKNGKITEFGQTIDACALGSAASAMVCEYIIGATFDEIMQAQQQVKSMLKQSALPPTGRFSELAILQSIKDMPNRHASTMLILDALVDAIEEIR